MDLNKLLGGPQFLISSTLSMNGCGTVTKSLIDTGANGFLFINCNFAIRISKALGAPIRYLPYSVPVRGFKKDIKTTASQFIRLHLTIDQRRFYNVPFVILDLGVQDVIVGIKWMRRFHVKLDTQRNKLIWPSEYPPNPSFTRDILFPAKPPRDNIQQSATHQEDAFRRDQALVEDEIRRRNGNHSVRKKLRPIPMSLIYPMEGSIRKPKTDAHKPGSVPNTGLSICEIGPNAFYYLMKNRQNEVFFTSLYEVDRILDEREPEEDLDTQELIENRLPKRYSAYRDVFSKTESDRLPPHREYDHKIQLEGPLPNRFSPLYRQSTAELKATKDYLIENLNKGFIVNSQSPFASPILFVSKPNGSLRFCIDYRRLNELTRKDPYPIPRIDELLSRVSKAKVFTKLDIRQAFHRIRMDPESEEYTTFRTRYGSYKCKVLPFGLCNGPATYQRYMNDVLMDYLDDFCMAYLDDILIYSNNALDHAEHVQKVLRRLREAGLQADIKKCEFDVQRTKYLGYILTTTGTEVDPEKVQVLRDWRRPNTIMGVKSYLGFCGFYRQFIRNFGKIAKPLSDLTKPSIPFQWTEDCTLAFDELRNQLLAVQAVYHFDPELPTKLETDSSDGVIAGVFSQEHDGNVWRPVGFYSHVLVGHEINWEIHDKELFAIVEAFRKWRPEFMSVRHRIEVYSDHRSLEYFMTTKVLTAKQVRWMEFLSDFNFQIRYTSGKNNQKADILSRREQDLVLQEQVKRDSRSRVLLGPTKIDDRIATELVNSFVEISLVSPLLPAESDTDSAPTPTDLLQRLREDNRQSFLELREELPAGYTIEDSLLLFEGRLCVNRNTTDCTQLIREAHDQPSSAHPSGKKTYQLLVTQYYWNGMGSDCKRYVKNCAQCQLSHTRQSKQPGFLNPLPISDYPMQHLCMDFKEFPTDRHGFDCILVFIDRLSKASVTIPCHKTIDARGMATLFIQWIYRFGHTPETIISDRGAQFISSFWHEFCRIIGVKVKLSTAYHKETDGQTEIMNRYIDQRLRPYVNYYQDNWSEMIPLMDRAQLTLPHSSIGMAPYTLQFGTEPRQSWDWKTPKAHTPLEKLNYADARALAERMRAAWEVAKGNMEEAQERMRTATNKHRTEVNWEVGDKVYLSTRNLKSTRPSRKLSEPWTGPFKVLERVGHSYRLELPSGSSIHDVFAPELLKRASDDPLTGQESAQPPGEIIAGETEWELEEILAVKLVRKTLKYRASWVGYDPDPAWYPASNFMGSPHKLREFHERNPNEPGPPRMLQKWIEAWEQGRDDFQDLTDNAPVEKLKT